METFYRVREKNKPNSNGIIVRMKGENSIDFIAGNSDWDIRISKGALVIDENAFAAEQISKDQADRLKEDYHCWILMQGYCNNSLGKLHGTPGMTHSIMRFGAP
jgi:hypothetical protein